MYPRQVLISDTSASTSSYGDHRCVSPQSPSSLGWLWGLEIAASDTWDSKKEAHCPHSPTYSRGGLRQVVPLSLVFFICKVSKVEPSS